MSFQTMENDDSGWSQLGVFITEAEDVVFAVPVDDHTGEYLDLGDTVWFLRQYHFDSLG